MTIIDIQNIRSMQRWLSGQYRNFRQKLTGWRYNQQYFYKNLKPVDFEQFSFFVCTAIEAVKKNDKLSISYLKYVFPLQTALLAEKTKKTRMEEDMEHLVQSIGDI